MKVINLTLQIPSLTGAHLKGLGGSLNKYSPSYLILYFSHKEGPQNFISFSPHKTWIHPLIYLLIYLFYLFMIYCSDINIIHER